MRLLPSPPAEKYSLLQPARDIAQFYFRMSSSLCRESAGLAVGFWNMGGVGCEAESAA